MLSFHDDVVVSRADCVRQVVEVWLARHPELPVSGLDMEKSLEQLLTHFLASGPGQRRKQLPAGSLELFARAGVDPRDAAVCRSFTKGVGIAPPYAAVFVALGVELAPVATAVQLARTPVRERAVELVRDVGLFREKGAADAPITGDHVKDRVVSVVRPVAQSLYVRQPGLHWREYLGQILGDHLDAMGREVFGKVLALTEKRLPSRDEREVLADFERLWGAVTRQTLVNQARRICGDAAEDAVQDAAARVLRCVRDRPAFEPPAPAAWLHTVVHRTALATAKKAGKGPVPLEQLPVVVSRPELDWFEALDAQASVGRAVAAHLATRPGEDPKVAALAVWRCFVEGEQSGEEAWHDLDRTQLLRTLAASIRTEAGSAARARRLAIRALDAYMTHLSG